VPILGVPVRTQSDVIFSENNSTCL